ncbi:MAG: hypothetical protein WAW17_31070 [Rhodococcus sp. (in: high G+C Gram-positive bacteria)]|uniref:hypothetical protein n=1 Tax=Rhodococcus sp. TaxID=1831 RepID=UPI003BAE643C
MSTTIVLDTVIDPIAVARAIYADLRVEEDPDFDDLGMDMRAELLGMVFALDPADPYIEAAEIRLDPADFGF